MIEYDVIEAGEPADGTVLVLLHGRGADRSDMRGLAAQVPRSWTTVVADAPHPAAPWGYGPGRAWYRYLGGTTPEPESFAASLAALDELLAALAGSAGASSPAGDANPTGDAAGRVNPPGSAAAPGSAAPPPGSSPRRLVLGGFSQGGTMSLAYALTRPGRVSHVLNFSGFLADHPDVRTTPESVRGVRIFWGHGFSDPSIPYAYAEAGQDALRAAGASLEARDYPIGHWIDPLELAHAVAFVQG